MAVVSLAIILLVASAWLARSNLAGVLETGRLGDQISETQLLAERVLSTLKDAETGQRGYLRTAIQPTSNPMMQRARPLRCCALSEIRESRLKMIAAERIYPATSKTILSG